MTTQSRSRIRRHIEAATTLAVLASVCCTACATDNATGAPSAANLVTAATATPSVRATAQWSGSRAYIPKSLAELNDKATLVVAADVTDTSTIERVNDVPFTVRTVKVVDTSKGEAPETLRVRELGDGKEPTSLQPGTRHVLFLAPFDFPAAKASNQYVIVGATSGDYVIPGGTSRAAVAPTDTATRVDTEASGLPATIKVDELLAAARR